MDERGVGGQGWLFVQFLRQLLASLPGVTDLEVQRDLSTVDVPADLVARSEGRPLLVEVNLQTPQTRRHPH